jgi:hypothetical protein
MSSETTESSTDISQQLEPIASGPLCDRCRSCYFAFESAILHFQQYEGRNYGFAELNRGVNGPVPVEHVSNRPLDFVDEWWEKLIEPPTGINVTKEDFEAHDRLIKRLSFRSDVDEDLQKTFDELENTPSFWAIDTGCEDIHTKDQQCMFAKASQAMSTIIETKAWRLERSTNLYAWRLPDFWISYYPNNKETRDETFEARANGTLSSHLLGVDVAFLPWKPPLDLKNMDNILLGAMEAGMIIGTPRARGSRFMRRKLVPPSFDTEKAQKWLASCLETHPRDCNYEVELPNQPPIMLIDCEDLSIREAKPGCQWFALSYVWSIAHGNVSPKDVTLEESNGLKLPCKRPNIVMDAIKVTLALGYKYLWIDKYCIDQENSAMKALQLVQMREIYHGAVLTIIGAADSDGLPGVDHLSRVEQASLTRGNTMIFSTGPNGIWQINNSKWSKRGWTFQESYLSRRRLYFTNHEMIFECWQPYSFCESLGGIEFGSKVEEFELYYRMTSTSRNSSEDVSSLRTQPSDRQMAQLGNGQNEDLWDFYRLVKKYSVRELTYDTDILTAFHGILTLFERLDPPLHNLLGVPCLPSHGSRTSADCLSIFARALLWHHSGLRWGWQWYTSSVPVSRNHSFPTWTWAGWHGEVSWMLDIREASEEKGFSPLIESIGIEGRCGTISSLCTPDSLMSSQIQKGSNFDPWILIIDGFVVSHDLICFGVWPGPEATGCDEHQLGFLCQSSRNWAKKHGIDIQEFEDRFRSGSLEWLLIGEKRTLISKDGRDWKIEIWIMVIDWESSKDGTAQKVTMFFGDWTYRDLKPPNPSISLFSKYLVKKTIRLS